MEDPPANSEHGMEDNCDHGVEDPPANSADFEHSMEDLLVELGMEPVPRSAETSDAELTGIEEYEYEYERQLSELMVNDEFEKVLCNGTNDLLSSNAVLEQELMDTQPRELCTAGAGRRAAARRRRREWAIPCCGRDPAWLTKGRCRARLAALCIA